ncbi:hypothetical protein NMG60_11034072 [Bertholletia excelsa]
MDHVVQEYRYSSSINLFGFEQVLIPAFSDQNPANGLEHSGLASDRLHHFDFFPSDPNLSNFTQSPCTSSEENVSEAVLEYVNQMLMEDDLENRLNSLQDSAALQAAEKSLYDALGEKYPPSPNEEDFSRTDSSHSNNSSPVANNYIDFNFISDQIKFGSSVLQSNSLDHEVDNLSPSLRFLDAGEGTLTSLVNSFRVLDPSMESQLTSQLRGEVTSVLSESEVGCEKFNSELKEKTDKGGQSLGLRRKNHCREDADYMEEAPSNKQLASYAEDSDEPLEMYDNVLLSPDLNLNQQNEPTASITSEASENLVGRKLQDRVLKGSNRGRPNSKKMSITREVVDLITLLTQRAYAVANNDNVTANELLKQIRLHSSPLGDSAERTAHYFGNAIEARLAGTGRLLDASPVIKKLSVTDTLKAYKAFLAASPFRKNTHFFLHKSIWKVAEKATRLHLIDFGIIHGFQWPQLIQQLSLRPGGPPTVCITGIDFPQPGFRPAERVEETGRRLKYYCERFNVPFEYNGVAKKWETVNLEDLNLQKDEVHVVTCLYRLRYVPDESVDLNSPRDVVLNLIKRINPDLFVHAVVNGANSGPFFFTRFRETLSMTYATFDMFDAILPREDQGRMLYEREVLGRGAMSVVACDGADRIIRPETYKQWQVRHLRAGLKQVPLVKRIIDDLKAKVKLGYHKDFVIDEDSNWMLQGWKGRILSAISCWRPA